MPIYEYKCTVCDERLEVEQRISDDPLTSMRGCQVADDGSHRLKKVFSAIGIAFKGDGFYRNDARGAKPKVAAPSGSSDGSSDKASGTSSDTSSDHSTSKDGASSSDTSTSQAATKNGSSKPVPAKSSSGSD